MTTQMLQHAIEAAQVLSPREKYQFIEAVARSLTQADVLEAKSAAFKRGRLDTLAADFWPEDESADDINEYIAAQRRADLPQ